MGNNVVIRNGEIYANGNSLCLLRLVNIADIRYSQVAPVVHAALYMKLL